MPIPKIAIWSKQLQEKEKMPGQKLPAPCSKASCSIDSAI